MSNTTITFDSQAIFGVGEHAIRPLSWRRETLDRGFAGLNGVMSLDLGRRERKLKQHGQLSANSIAALLSMMENIATHIDGKSYELVDQNGCSYADIRMDNFTLLGPINTGNQVRCEYEIIYTQLSA